MTKNKINKIKFDHDFCKLHGQKKATLLAVSEDFASKLSDKTIQYDVEYEDEQGAGRYPFPSNGAVIKLVFLGDEDIPFTSFRKWKTKTFKSYESKIGQEYNIIIKKPKAVKEEAGEEEKNVSV